MAKTEKYSWQFKPRFRSGAFGWKSQPAITRVKEAVSEIKKVSKKEPVLAAEGAVLFFEKVSDALKNVDGSSGGMGLAVNKAIAELVPIIVKAPVDLEKRKIWLERLFEAHQDDSIPYIETLTDYWGELCASKELASYWADQLINITSKCLNRTKDEPYYFFNGTTACLNALFTAERYEELIDLVSDDSLWDYKRWAAKAFAAQGSIEKAIQYAESSRNPWASDLDIDQVCEEMLISSGAIEKAYSRYGLSAGRKNTYLAWLRNIVKKYPHKNPRDILKDLIEYTPGDEGKWFAASKSLGLLDEAAAIANLHSSDPRTLTRAARDFKEKNPSFAIQVGTAALVTIAKSGGFDITFSDINEACKHTLEAAENMGTSEQILTALRAEILQTTTGMSDVNKMVDKRLGIVR